MRSKGTFHGHHPQAYHVLWSHYDTQAGLELLGPNDPPTSVSQVNRITGACHSTQACIDILM
uniref:Uncharacterized protein n=1 Tax=Spermophilus dauricus TaxID=99837 RepID=A0A8C9Q8C5_SPEDA